MRVILGSIAVFSSWVILIMVGWQWYYNHQIDTALNPGVWYQLEFEISAPLKDTDLFWSDDFESVASGICQHPPETDKDVYCQIRNIYNDPILKQALKGLYQSYRGIGDDVLTAWIKTLEAHVEVIN